MTVDDAPQLLERATGGNRRATGRLLSMIERDPATARSIDELTARRGGHAHVVGVTGAPGAGKSTLTGSLAATLAHRGRRTAILAIDPTSPRTGGAILGDRIRMDDTIHDVGDRVFVRSMATRGQHGGLALAVPSAVRLLDACSYHTVIVESAGVGQVEMDIVTQADTTVVVMNPGWGDAIQANKAGLLELADIFAVNKADRAGADQTVRDLDHMIDLTHIPADQWRPPVLRTVATDHTGIDALADTIAAHHAHLERSGERATRRRQRYLAEVRANARQNLEGALDRALADPPCRPDATPAAVAAEITARLLRYSP